VRDQPEIVPARTHALRPDRFPGVRHKADWTMAIPLRLLLIVDSEDDAALVVRALTFSGYDVMAERVETGAALVEALEKQRWDLAIADYSMPRFSGTAALELLRERDPDMPFIFVSDTTGDDAAVTAIKAGAQDYIMRGNLKRLIPAVERELRETSARRQRKLAEQRLAHLAYHDVLTDLPNRALLFDRLQQSVLAAHRSASPLTLLVMDLDRFKDINDTMGHHAGDRLLQLVGSRLRGTVREADTVARLGGDEFALILPSTDIAGAVLAARKVLQELAAPFVVESRSLSVHASVGVARFPDHGRTAEMLLQKADIAMYFAKADGSGVAVYTPDRDRYVHRRLGFVTDLTQAIDDDEFFVEYQPILNLGTGRVRGVEALVRWNHPQQGRLLPAEFIPLAEQTGLILPLTTLVLDTALNCFPKTEQSIPLSIAVNLSPRNLRDPDLAQRVADRLRARGAAAASLTFEITENVIMSDPVRSMESLTRLHEMGVRLAIDDFGTGYSSLGYLRRLPVDELKIDRTFVSGLGSGNDEVIVRSAIDLAHNLGLSVVAEGVESLAVQEQLVALGCDAAQGFFIGAPADADVTRQRIAGLTTP
jgi:diguanylate cyclase (GGDEF)-like protein